MHRATLMLLAAPVWGADFARSVYPALEAAQCRYCHNDNGVASATRLQFPAENAAGDAVDAFGLRLRALVDPKAPEQSLLLSKPTNRVSHTGGERIRRGSTAEGALREWVMHLAKLPETSTAGGAESRNTPTLRRLTHSQYNNTVRDLLGDRTGPATQFPKEDWIHGYTNQAEGQNISPILAEAYNRAAERLARNAFRGGDRHGLIPCKPSGPSDAGCRDRFIGGFGARAYRRPLSDAEIRRYAALFSPESTRSGDFIAGAQAVVETMLQSPHFLFRMEDGAWRTASRLSYFLWDAAPDAALARAAASGDLETAAGIERAARRMMADPRAPSAMDEFLAQWLRFDRLQGAVRESRIFPEFTAELTGAMAEETRRLFRHLVWNNGNFLEFFTADYAFLNTSLTQLYGLPAPPEDYRMVRFPAGSPRAGVLGQGTYLTLTSKPADTSPTERGIFLREHFLCQIVPPPPPGVNANLPPATDDKPLTQKDRLAVHLSSEACAGCHRLIDPIGFGFEQFDAIGKFRREYHLVIHPTADELVKRTKTKPTEYRLPIDSAGQIQGMGNGRFTSPAEAGRLLAADPGCQRCIVKQLFRYATGRQETAADQPAIDDALGAFRNSQFRFQDLIIAIVKSRPFLED